MQISIRASYNSMKCTGFWASEIRTGTCIDVLNALCKGRYSTYSLALRGVIRSLQNSIPDEPIAIIANDESFIRIGNWLVSEYDREEISAEEVRLFYEHRNSWRQLFSLTPSGVSFHYDNSPLRYTIPTHSLERMRDATRTIDFNEEETI